MKKIFMLIAVLTFTASLAQSQARDYNTGIGIRGGWDYGLTIKHFGGNDTAFEGIVSTRWHGYNVTGLFEIHKNAFDLNRLNWYYGLGGHIGFWDGDNVKWADDKKNYTILGIDGILGLEWSISEIPFCISIDWKPTYNLVGYSGFWGDQGAVSIRYIF
ncbi:hypothetical protein ACFL4B_04235 [Candidatus Neomarinimicrobiota bacterium]